MQGHGWETGRLREVLQGLIDKHADVRRPPPFVYKGPLIGPTAAAVLKAWQDSPEAQACCIYLMRWPLKLFAQAVARTDAVTNASRIGAALFQCHSSQLPMVQACVAPEDWRPPPPAGFLDAAGMRRIEEEDWRPVSAQLQAALQC